MTTTIHPDDIAVDNFAAAMKLKLAAAREKGRSGWDNKELCSGEYLAQNLVVHLSRGNAGTFEDIANFAMMLHQRGEDPALLKTQVDLNARVLAEGVLNKVVDKWAAELTEKTEISQAHLDNDHRPNGERLTDAIFTDVMSDPALQSLMAAEFKINALTAQLREANNGYPLVAHLVRQIGFSQKAFGPGLRTCGILDHIAKELKEVAEKPHDLSEWIDVAMLALDGAWRHAIRDGVSDQEIAQQVVDTLQAKLAKNEKRDWPDWRLLGEDKAIEHKRDKEAGAA
jgi:hypothetical protein